MSLKVLCIVLLVPAVLCFSLEGFSQDEEKKTETEETHPPGEEYETVVSASRFEDDEFEVPRSVEVIDGEDMEGSKGRSTPELLEQSTGVFVQKTSYGGGAPIIRGVIGINNLILFNEIKLNNSTWRTGPIQYLNLIDPFSIQKVEILRGPGSLLYGSDAIGGVISIFGKGFEPSGTPLLAPELAGKFSSADTSFAGHYSLGGSCRHLGLVFGGSYKLFNDLSAGSGVGVQPFSGYREADFDFNTRIKLWSAGTLELGAYMVRLFDAGRTDQLKLKNRLKHYDNYRDLVYARLIGDHEPLGLTYKITLSYQKQTEKARDIKYESLYDVIDRTVYDSFYVDTVGLSGVVRKKFLDERLELSGGFDMYLDFVDAESFKLEQGSPLAPSVALFPPDSRYDTYEVYAVLQWNIKRILKGLHLWGGARFTYTTAFAPDLEDFGDVSYSHPGGIGSGGIFYTWRESLNVGVTWAEGFRSPKLSETVILGDMGSNFEIPNPDLGPEKADSVELYIRGRHELIEADVTGYTIFFRDLLQKVPATYNGQTEVDGKPVMRTENLSDAMLFGTELSLVFSVGKLIRLDGLKLKGNLTYLWGNEEHCADDVCQDTPMTRIPPLFFTAILGYYGEHGSDLEYSAELLYRGALKQDRLSPADEQDIRIPAGGTPGWNTLSLHVMMEYRERVLVAVLFDNLTNETYRIHGSGIFEPGTSFSMNVALRY